MSIGASIVVKGSITSAESLTIDGRVEGDIVLQEGQLVLAPGSHVVGDITVPSAVVHGIVEGTLTATSRVEVRPSASVSGTMAAATIGVAEGAQLNCRVEMPVGSRPRAAAPGTRPQMPVAV